MKNYLVVLMLCSPFALEAGIRDARTGEPVEFTERMCMRAFEYGYWGTDVTLGEFNFETQKFETRYLCDESHAAFAIDIAEMVSEQYGSNKMTYIQVRNGLPSISVSRREDNQVIETIYQMNPDGSTKTVTLRGQEDDAQPGKA